MQGYRKLTTVCCAAVLALGLAACGGGGDGTPTASNGDTMQPDPAIAERAAINSAITTANTAVTGLTDDASDAAIGAADSAVANAKKAIADAGNVPASEKAAFNTAVTAIEGSLAAKKTSIMAAREAADEAMMAANAELGKLLLAALGPPATDTSPPTYALANIAAPTLSSAGLVIDAAAGAGAIDDATDPPSATLEAGASAGALGSWSGTDYSHSTGMGDARVINEARVYTNRGAPRTIPFAQGGHTIIATGNPQAGSVLVDAANLNLVMAAAFTHSGQQNHQVPDRSDALYVRGTYDGAPGEYRCATGCSSTNDGKGSPSELGGTWHFKPDTGAMVSRPDTEYLYYGWWVSKDSDGEPTAASAFAGVVEPNAGDLDNGGDLTALTGSATYEGNAVGKWAMSNPLTGTGNGGHFTADAELNATFSGTNPGVTGTIDNFRLNDGADDPGWSVALARGGLAAAGAINAPTADPTVWSINGNAAPASGTWSGTMYDEMPGDPPDGDGSNIPTTVTGTFYSEFSTIGRMVGAFGADKQ